MQRSSWMIVLLSSLVFLLTAWLFFDIGQKTGTPSGNVQSGSPTLVVPLDRESGELLEKLAQSRGEVDELREELASLEIQLMEREKSSPDAEEELEELRAEMKAQRERDNARLKREQARSEELQRKFDDLIAAHSESIELLDKRTAKATELPKSETLVDKLRSAPDDTLVAEDGLEEGLAAYKARDYESAYRTWLPLAKKGVSRAQFYIGGLYIDGQGVERDKAMAHYWLSLAEDAGYSPSTTLLEKVTAIMSAEELAAAEKLLESQPVTP